MIEERWRALAARCESEPYCRELGVAVDAIAEGSVRLRLPYHDKNSNPGQALHGGVAASMIDVAGTLAAWTGFESAADLDDGAIDVAVNYLSAAIGEEIVVDGRVLRRGKEITYVDVDVATTGGKRIAKGLVTHRAVAPSSSGRTFGEPPRESDFPPGEVPKLGRALTKVPFIGRLGMVIERMENGASRLRLPFVEANAGRAGAVHEGALIALVDTAGAMSSWSITGLDFSYKASTVAVNAGFAAKAVGEDVIALSKTLRRNEEIFWNSVAVVGATSGALVAHGDVVYRIVVP
jgi:uncharacterized protein (TIGR00369 family)